MGKTITQEVDVECDEDHCDEYTARTCPLRENMDGDLDESIQRIFRHYGPERERLCYWRKCMDEPWKSLADVLAP